MFGPEPSKSTRRRRLAATVALLGVFTYSGAGAQSDKDWVESALERTLRLSAPWELPSSPQLDQQLQSDPLLEPEISPEIDLVLEVPWGRETETPETEKESRVVVRVVDQFEDPWLPDDTVPEAASLERVDAQPSYQDEILIDPWAD